MCHNETKVVRNPIIIPPITYDNSVYYTIGLPMVYGKNIK